MKRFALRFVLTLSLIIIFSSIFVLAAPQTTTQSGTEHWNPTSGSFDANPSSQVANNIPDVYSNPNWKPEYSQYVPADKIGGIPPEKVDVAKVQDKTKLTSQQLSYGSNLVKAGTLSQYDSVAVRDAIKSKYPNYLVTPSKTELTVDENGILRYADGSTVNLNNMGVSASSVHSFSNEGSFLVVDDMRVQHAVNIHLANGDLVIDSAGQLYQGVLSLTNARNVVVHGKNVSFDSADTAVVGGVSNQNVTEFSSDTSTMMYEVSSADSIQAGFTRVLDVGDSIIDATYPNLTIKPRDAQNLTFPSQSDGADLVVEVSGSSFIAADIVSFPNQRLTFTDATVVVNDVNEVEIIKSNSTTSTVESGKQGIKCTSLGKSASYNYINKSLMAQSFSVLNANQSTYKLCLKKSDGDNLPTPTNETNYGLFSFVNQAFRFNGIIQYERFPFKQAQVMHVTMIPVYVSLDNHTKVSAMLDNDLVLVNQLYIENANYQKLNEYAKISILSYDITESGAERYAVVRKQSAGQWLKYYQDVNKAEIINVANETVIQNGAYNMTMFEAGSEPMKQFELSLVQYYTDFNIFKPPQHPKSGAAVVVFEDTSVNNEGWPYYYGIAIK